MTLKGKYIMKKGKFIVIDGCDGSGKTTMIKTLVEILPEGSFEISHEHGGTLFAQKIREVALCPEAGQANAETMFGLNWAARADHLKNKIIPTLESGKTMITDRFDSSTFAYQIYAQKCEALRELFWKTREVYLGDTKPDFYIFFDVESKTGLERVAKRKEVKNHWDERKLEFHQAVRKGFFEFLKFVPHFVIDANQSMEKVKADFHEVVLKVLKS